MDDQAILAKLDRIINLMVGVLTEGKSQKENIRVLSKAGFAPKDIGKILETTPNSVRVALFELRRAKKSKVKHK